MKAMEKYKNHILNLSWMALFLFFSPSLSNAQNADSELLALAENHISNDYIEKETTNYNPPSIEITKPSDLKENNNSNLLVKIANNSANEQEYYLKITVYTPDGWQLILKTLKKYTITPKNTLEVPITIVTPVNLNLDTNYLVNVALLSKEMTEITKSAHWELVLSL